jgi:hypothetical protein
VGFHRMNWQTAKVSRICDGCGRLIPAGSRYVYGAAKSEGELLRIGYCGECAVGNVNRYGWQVSERRERRQKGGG